MKMLTIRAMVTAITMAVSGWSAAAARATDPATERGPYIKNLMSPTYRPPAAPLATQKEFTKKDINRLTKRAETRGDHLKIARFWTAEANQLDARAAGYEHAAAIFRRGPVVKSLTAPTTAARWEFFAKELRNEATSDRVRAAFHEQMASEA